MTENKKLKRKLIVQSFLPLSILIVIKSVTKETLGKIYCLLDSILHKCNIIETIQETGLRDDIWQILIGIIALAVVLVVLYRNNILKQKTNKNLEAYNKEVNHQKELVEVKNKEITDSIRFSYYKQMDQIIIEEAPVVVLYYDQVLRFIQKNIKNLGSNPMNLLTLKRVRKN